jgi:ParB-like chromosome segregation protein Spo0J
MMTRRSPVAKQKKQPKGNGKKVVVSDEEILAAGSPEDEEADGPTKADAPAAKLRKRADKFAIDKKNEVLARLAVEYVDIASIKPNEYNPNRQSPHDFALLCKSIAADGFTQPVIVTFGEVIVDGEHRWRACKALGYTKIAIVRTKMSPEQARIATLRHNRARGSEDAGLAADVLRELAEMGALEFAKDELSLDAVEVQRLLEDMQAEDASGFEVTEEDLGPNGEGLTEQDKALGIDLESDIRRAKERKLQEAKEEEERLMDVADSKIYRLMVVFTMDQATVVDDVIGKDRANVILELCREADAASGPS